MGYCSCQHTTDYIRFLFVKWVSFFVCLYFRIFSHFSHEDRIKWALLYYIYTFKLVSISFDTFFWNLFLIRRSAELTLWLKFVVYCYWESSEWKWCRNAEKKIASKQLSLIQVRMNVNRVIRFDIGVWNSGTGDRASERVHAMCDTPYTPQHNTDGTERI